MKRFLAVILSLIFILAVAGCGGGEVILGRESSSEIPSGEPSNAPLDESGPPQNDGDADIETIPQEEQQIYFKKYIRPYYIVGLLDSTWSDPEEIEVLRYMQFYIYNESSNYWSENPAAEAYSIPWYTVEDYITSYFEVSPGYLRTAENYDSTIACYRSMMTEGIGDGPGVTIERIEKDGDIWKFICRDINDNLLSVTIRMVNEDTFHYVSGEVLERAEQPKTEERFDPMALGDHANILTEHLITTAFEKIGDYYSLDEKKYTHFAMGLARFWEEDAYLYRDVAFRGSNGCYYFREEYLKNMMWEVFGVEDWEPDRENWPMDYDEVRQEYIIDLAFDFWNLVETRITSTLVDTQDRKVVVDYDLYTSSLYPDPKKIAAMTTEYAIRFREDGTPYLRYAGTHIE